MEDVNFQKRWGPIATSTSATVPAHVLFAHVVLILFVLALVKPSIVCGQLHATKVPQLDFLRVVLVSIGAIAFTYYVDLTGCIF